MPSELYFYFFFKEKDLWKTYILIYLLPKTENEVGQWLTIKNKMKIFVLKLNSF